MRATRSFEPQPDQVVAARHFVVEVLASAGHAVGDVPLLVSELATNAVLHARSDFLVTVEAEQDGPGRVRVEVSDRNSRLPSFAAVKPDAYSGRGLMLVQTLSAAWGVDAHAEEGKTIWFEVHDPAG